MWRTRSRRRLAGNARAHLRLVHLRAIPVWCATMLRLGTLRPPAHATSNLVRRAAAPTEEGEEVGLGRTCGSARGTRCIHPLLCKAGPGRMRPYKHLAATLARCFHAAGADVDLERVVPELADVNSRDAAHHDAIMDAVAFWPGGMATSWIDVSIRCPHGARYTCAHKQAGHAAGKAAEEKFERYGPQVLPLTLESYGRLGATGRRTLEALALLAASCMRDHWAVPRFVPRWQASMERVVISATADVVLLALGAKVMERFGT